MLKIVLSTRGVVALAFGAVLLISKHDDIASVSSLIGAYALADGCLGGLMCALLINARTNHFFVTICFGDALAKMFVGAFMIFNPGWHSSFLGGIYLTTLTTILCLTIGAASIAILLITNHMKKFRLEDPLLFWVSLLMSLATIFLGVGLPAAASEETRRVVMMVFALVTGSGFLYVAFKSKSNLKKDIESIKI